MDMSCKCVRVCVKQQEIMSRQDINSKQDAIVQQEILNPNFIAFALINCSDYKASLGYSVARCSTCAILACWKH